MKTYIIHSRIFYWLALISLLSIGASRPNFTNEKYFRQTDTVVFGVIGDYGIAGPAEADVARLVIGWNPNFIVTLGDNNYPNGAANSIDQNIGQYYHDFIFRYTGEYGKGSGTRRFFPAMGNHDWHNGSPNPHVNYFNLPGDERYYDFIQGPVHFFILDSVEEEFDGNTAGSGQGRWLKNALANSTSQFNVVVTHYPPYSSGEHGAVSFMQWPFKEWGADVVLAGHDHDYERLLVNGMPYFVNGLGGDELGNFRPGILPESLVRYNGDFGAMRVEATSTYMKFQFVTRNNVLVDEYVLSNSIPVVSSISSAAPKPSNAAVLDFNVTFSESVSGVDVSDFALTANGITGAFVSNVNGAGANYTVSVNTGMGNGDLRLDLLDNDSIVDIHGATLGNAGAGNGNFSSEVYLLDKTAPVVSAITRVNTSPTNAASVDFAIAFSESVSGVDISDFSLSSSNGSGGAYISNVSGSGSAYIVTINTGSADNILRLDLTGNGIVDAAGNPPGGIFAAGESYTVDKTAPGIVSILRANPTPSGALSVDYNVTFSEPVSGVDAADFVVNTTGISGAFVSSISGSGSAYVVSVNTGNNSGDLRLDSINNLSIMDVVGNALVNTSAGETYTLDKTAPIVLSILRAGTVISNAGSVDFNVTFSDAVSGVDAADFVVNTSGVGNAFISNINGSGANYVVSVNTGSGDGTLRLNVIDDDSIVNAVGMPLGTAGVGNGNFSGNETYAIDKTPPAILSIRRANPDPSNAARVDFIVTFSEPVSGVDISDFNLNSTGGAVIAGVNGSGSIYTVSITTGIGLDSLRLDAADNDSIMDAANNPTGGVFTTGEVYTVNKVPPVVRSILGASSNPSNATNVDFIVTFSESVTGVDISDFILTTSGVSGAAITGISGANSSYVVSIITGINNGTIRLDATDNNSIVNSMGNTLGGVNVNDGNFTAGEIYEIVKFAAASQDFAAPVIASPVHEALLNTAAPNLSWTKVPGAQYYEVVIARDNAAAQIVSTQFVNENSFTSPSLGDGMYYWRVRAYNFNAQPGKFSAIESFIIDTTPPPVPVLLSPLNGTKLGARFKFTWVNSGAARYHIEIDNNADFSSPEWSSWRRDPLYQISGLKKGTYYWHVRAKDPADNWSAWSVTFKLIVP